MYCFVHKCMLMHLKISVVPKSPIMVIIKYYTISMYEIETVRRLDSFDTNRLNSYKSNDHKKAKFTPLPFRVDHSFNHYHKAYYLCRFVCHRTIHSIQKKTVTEFNLFCKLNHTKTLTITLGMPITNFHSIVREKGVIVGLLT